MREIIVEINKEKRFKPTRIVGFLLDTSKVGLNELWQMHNRQIFTNDEMKEFYQLLGVSICCYEEVFGDESV